MTDYDIHRLPDFKYLLINPVLETLSRALEPTNLEHQIQRMPKLNTDSMAKMLGNKADATGESV
ncbi:hypothetical protein N7495_005555 [Penicillium taxi]|uniref:uncharacterized protein n=1 Tax=Penicillium taxi TaxID=168475 RepID=UPI0025452064|nr:uncharacterized protein N7495_005555 [Penicillium taxi]KAJ5893864.1 hypothetical protein N7495_005555 [Penicillium taxi]